MQEIEKLKEKNDNLLQVIGQKDHEIAKLKQNYSSFKAKAESSFKAKAEGLQATVSTTAVSNEDRFLTEANEAEDNDLDMNAINNNRTITLSSNVRFTEGEHQFHLFPQNINTVSQRQDGLPINRRQKKKKIFTLPKFK